MLILSWRKAPVPAAFVAGVPRTDPQTAEEKEAAAPDARRARAPGS